MEILPVIIALPLMGGAYSYTRVSLGLESQPGNKQKPHSKAQLRPTAIGPAPFTPSQGIHQSE